MKVKNREFDYQAQIPYHFKDGPDASGMPRNQRRTKQMPNIFSSEFTDFFCRSYRIWLLFNCRQQRVDADVPASLERMIFSSPSQTAAVSPFRRDLCREIHRSTLEALLAKAGGPDGPADPDKIKKLLKIPISDENNWELVLSLFLHERLRSALGQIKSLERFYPRDLFSQDTWRLNKVVNSLGRLYLPELDEDAKALCLEIVSRLHGLPFSPGVQPGFNAVFQKETVQSLGHVLDSCVPKSQFDDYDDALFIHRNLEVLSLSSTEFHGQIFFLLEILDNFLSFIGRFNAGQA